MEGCFKIVDFFFFLRFFEGKMCFCCIYGSGIFDLFLFLISFVNYVCFCIKEEFDLVFLFLSFECFYVVMCENEVVLFLSVGYCDIENELYRSLFVNLYFIFYGVCIFFRMLSKLWIFI